ncbi:MAG: type II toxin-antitoxin system VapC family toxin [Actinobacteria bacterium]|nr:type II toxin-antitoxin system VapC family toxin [Actinomycetota bacterium]
MFYLDTSAAVRLVVAEAGSRALRTWLSSRQDRIASSDLLRTELLRVTRRAAPEAMVQARAVLDAVILLKMTTAMFERAATLDPEAQRSLDSLHLAAAMEFGDDLEGIITYDTRLAAGAAAVGVTAVAPR